MRKFKISVALFLLGLSVFAQKTIVVSNLLNFDRKAEIVEVSLSALKIPEASNSWILKDAQGKEVGYQLIPTENKIIFQANVKAKSSAAYSLTKGTPAAVQAKTYGRFIPERKDDFAWENDFAAYRMYGPALANENPSNGVDYWAKCTDELVVNQRYKDDINNGISYHIDHGKGLDFYKVAHTLGCGGIAPYADDSLWIGNQFDSYKVLESGPLRTIFQLTYNSFKVGSESYKETITITATAGSLLNKAEVIYSGKERKIKLASGIFLHDQKGGNLQLKKENGTVAYAEEAVSDFKVPAGRDYVGVFVPAKGNDGLKKGDHALILSNYKVGDTFIYYFGAGWSKWKYPTDADWFKAIDEFTLKTSNPLKVTIK